MKLGKVALVTFLLCTGSALGQPAPQLFRVKHDTYGCAVPRATTALTNRSDPRQSNPDWVAFVVSDGHCVTITPRSEWRLVFKDGDLAFMTYAGTTAPPGSFYIRVDELSAQLPPSADPLRPALSNGASALAPEGEQTRPPVTATPLPQPVQTQNAVPDGKAPIQPPKVQALPTPSVAAKIEPPKPPSASSAPSPSIAATSPAQPPVLSSSGQSQHSGGEVIGAACAIIALLWLASRRKFPATKKAKVAKRQEPRPAGIVKPAQPKPAVWLRNGQPVSVAGFTIPGDFVYVGAPPARGTPPPCLIDPSLPIASGGPASPKQEMPYWPSYSAISPRCRFAYLRWLADGRADPTAYIGYVFLFFYGLERRMFVDGTDNTEVQEMVNEVGRLLTIYGGNKSFRGYATGFIEAVQVRLLATTGSMGDYKPSLDAPAHQMPLALKVTIATRVAAGQALSFDLAMAGLLGLPSEVLALSARVLGQARPQFIHLMRARFEEACPMGYKLADGRVPRLELKHRCATAGLTVDLLSTSSRKQLPDPAALAWDKLVALAVPVAAQLEEFAKLKDRHPERAQTLSALAALPLGFNAETVGSTASKAKRWLEQLPKPIAQVGFADLAEHALGTRATKWTVQHYQAVSQALAATEYGLEPQPNHGNASVSDDTAVFVFPDTDARRERTPSYSAAVAGAELVEAVSRVDPTSADAVRTGWLAEVGERMPLPPQELVRLDARLRWLQHARPSTTRMRQRLGMVSPSERATVAKLAAGAAAAAGAVAKGQMALLEKVYDEFGLDRRELYTAVHEAAAKPPEPEAASVPVGIGQTPSQDGGQQSDIEQVRTATGVVVPLRPRSKPSGEVAGPSDVRSTPTGKPLPAAEPVPVSEAIPERVHRIPPPPPPAKRPDPPAAPSRIIPPPTPMIAVPILDPDRIRRIKAETERVSTVLADVFVEEEQAHPAVVVSPPTDDALPGRC